jgi:hypothetical protein
MLFFGDNESRSIFLKNHNKNTDDFFDIFEDFSGLLNENNQEIIASSACVQSLKFKSQMFNHN